MNLTKAIEVTKGVRGDEFIAGIQEDNVSRTVFREERTDALTTLITLAESVDAAKVDDAKVWRGKCYQTYRFNKDNEREFFWLPDHHNIAAKPEEIVALPAATHDALVARNAVLEQQVTTMREEQELFLAEIGRCWDGLLIWYEEADDLKDIYDSRLQKVEDMVDEYRKRTARRALAQEGGEGANNS